MKHWQESMLEELVSYFEAKDEILGLLLFGSLGKAGLQPDDWSDIDLLVVVEDDKIDRFFPAMDWVTSFGRLYTYSQSAADFKCTTRVCFENFNRVDFVFTREADLAEVKQWSSIPFSSGARVLFSRSKIVDEITNQNLLPKGFSPATQEQFLELVRDFRFKSMLAVYKVVRDDLLIALHLAHDLVRDCCVLAMMLRDRAAGTNVHKHGGIGNQFVPQLAGTGQPFTSIGILDSIKASNEVFETLARQWSEEYQENRRFLLDWIEKAKLKLGKE